MVEVLAKSETKALDKSNTNAVDTVAGKQKDKRENRIENMFDRMRKQCSGCRT